MNTKKYQGYITGVIVGVTPSWIDFKKSKSGELTTIYMLRGFSLAQIEFLSSLSSGSVVVSVLCWKEKEDQSLHYKGISKNYWKGNKHQTRRHRANADLAATIRELSSPAAGKASSVRSLGNGGRSAHPLLHKAELLGSIVHEAIGEKSKPLPRRSMKPKYLP